MGGYTILDALAVDANSLTFSVMKCEGISADEKRKTRPIPWHNRRVSGRAFGFWSLSYISTIFGMSTNDVYGAWIE
ncbi:MAG: hypothetical protein Q7R42_06945 [Candidatus Planktophila sp.]|nr:hypothetical protein [Candidatus Planktophila sp.]